MRLAVARNDYEGGGDTKKPEEQKKAEEKKGEEKKDDAAKPPEVKNVDIDLDGFLSLAEAAVRQIHRTAKREGLSEYPLGVGVRIRPHLQLFLHTCSCSVRGQPFMERPIVSICIRLDADD